MVTGVQTCALPIFRPCDVADEERIAGQHEPGLVCPRAVDHGEGAMLGPVARRVNRADDDLAQLDLCAVVQRLMGERRFGGAVYAHREAVLQREAPVARDVVCMRMRLEDGDELDVSTLALIQILLDRVGRIDEDGDSRVLVSDEVGSTPQIVVDELLEEHERDGSNQCGYIS